MSKKTQRWRREEKEGGEEETDEPKIVEFISCLEKKETKNMYLKIQKFRFLDIWSSEQWDFQEKHYFMFFYEYRFVFFKSFECYSALFFGHWEFNFRPLQCLIGKFSKYLMMSLSLSFSQFYKISSKRNMKK